ncbi:hypothetical protein HQ585_10285 [candidate division KSB1 bacterium]|nr:hypothetical protein [candidate division KSB1 bacterium]
MKKYGLIHNTTYKTLSRNELSLFDIVRLFWLEKWKIAASVTVATILSIIIALSMPLTFRATSVIMPPSSESGLGISSILSSLPLGNLLQSGGDSEAMKFIAILKSRIVSDDVIEKFNLFNYYDVNYYEDALDELYNNTNFEISEEGTIVISAIATTSWFHPEEDVIFSKNLAVEMANYYVSKLDQVNKSLKGEKARLHREFIEKRYNMNLIDLHDAENRLNEFQKKHRTIALPEQTTAAITIATGIKGQLLTAEVELDILQQSMPFDHPDVQNVINRIKKLDAQLSSMNNGLESDFLFPRFAQIPDLGLELGRLMRDVEIQNTIFVFLTQQYEEAKIQELRDNPTIQVLDYAQAPQKKYKPTRSRIVIIGFALSFVLSLYIIYFYKRFSEDTYL